VKSLVVSGLQAAAAGGQQARHTRNA
jgi:hypothetical protein